MRRFSDWPLKRKILLPALEIIVTLSVVLFLLFSLSSRQKSIKSYVEKARAICLTAESAREEMEEKWRQKLFTTEMLVEFARKGENDKILLTVPVITAWRAAMRKAEEGGYQFRTPKFNPRNPQNLPDFGLNYTVEGPALQKISGENLREYYLIDSKINAIRYFLPVRLSPVCLNCHGDPQTAKTLWQTQDGTDPTGGGMENRKAGEIHGAFEVIQSLQGVDENLFIELIKAGILVLAALGLTAFVMRYIASGISRPMSELIRTMEKVKAGDLTARSLVVSLDETGKLAGWFNSLMDSLQEIIRRMAVSVETLRYAVGEISEVVENQNAIAAQQSVSVSEITSAMTELSATSKHIARHTDEVAEIASGAWDHTKIGAEGAGKLAEKIDEINQEDRKKILKITELGKVTAEIGKVMEIINNITDQTKLIAFNAALEASSAGEAGRRFGVVAGEIRRLAESVMDSTSEIETRINEIQGAVTQMIFDSEKSSRNITQGLEFARSMEGKFREIVGGARVTTEAARQISLSTKEQKTASEQVVSTLREIEQGARQNAEAIVQMGTIIRELTALSANLKELVDQFNFKTHPLIPSKEGNKTLAPLLRGESNDGKDETHGSDPGTDR